MTALLRAVSLARSYRSQRGTAPTAAVDGVDLQVTAGESIAVVGASGAGKSTLTRLLLALEKPDSGFVEFDGHRISHLGRSALRPLRRRFQAVFQDPTASLNPHLRIATTIAEPLVAHGIGDRDSRRSHTAQLLEAVGLPPEAGEKYPSAFSSGERQRIAIARALACRPELLILDEPVASLDAAVKAQIVDLVAGLRRDLGLTLVVVSHDLATVGRIAERTLVMDAGRIVEEARTREIFDNPRHAATQRLIG